MPAAGNDHSVTMTRQYTRTRTGETISTELCDNDIFAGRWRTFIPIPAGQISSDEGVLSLLIVQTSQRAALGSCEGLAIELPTGRAV